MSPHTSFFERRQTVPILLQSLLVTFEGQTELVTEDTGYSALRLCSISKELVDGEPIEMNNEGDEDESKPGPSSSDSQKKDPKKSRGNLIDFVLYLLFVN